MTVLDLLASRLGTPSEVPNQELAQQLVSAGDIDGIAEIAAGLWDREPAVRSDCIKVMVEIGAMAPELAAPYALAFVRLLGERQNRLVWGGMQALSAVAGIAADDLVSHVPEIEAAIASGSVITVDHGIKTLARLAASNPERNAVIFPFLLAHLEICRAKEVPQHAESTAIAVTRDNREPFRTVLIRRLPEFTPAQSTRVKHLFTRIEQ